MVKAVKKAKSKFERKLSKEARRKPRAFYAYVNKQTKSRVSVGPLKDSNGDVKFQLLKFWILSLVLYSPRKILVIHHNLKQHLKERFSSQKFTLLQKSDREAGKIMPWFCYRPGQSIPTSIEHFEDWAGSVIGHYLQQVFSQGSGASGLETGKYYPNL